MVMPPVLCVQRVTMTDLPRGTVTFLFTDIEGSTALWERDRQFRPWTWLKRYADAPE